MEHIATPTQTRRGQPLVMTGPSAADMASVTTGSYFFLDGNVDIVAQRTAFRVHRGILARHSPIFHDLFFGRTLPVSGGTPGPGRSMGLAFVANEAMVFYVTDRAQDIAELLHVLYDGLTREVPVTSFPSILSLLRLGVKYEIRALLDEVVPLLSQAFPTTLDEWDRAYRKRNLKDFRITGAVEALNVFRATQQLAMCPSALYLCAQLARESIRSGVRRLEDGALSRLSEADAVRCLVAKEQLRMDGAEMLALCRSVAPAEGCTCTEKCHDAMSVFREPPAGAVQNITNGNVLHAWPRDRVAELRGKMLVCDGCSGTVLGRIDELRRRVWNGLPRMAGLEGKIEEWGVA